MSRVALFIDLPNFYSHLLRSGIEDPRSLRDYFLYWLDLDLLAQALMMPGDLVLGIWVFYSGERIGPSDNRVEGRYLRDYTARVNALAGVTARDVNIRGEQREPVRVQCSKCGAEGVGEWVSEKGVDASLTVHLFDTMESWDIAYLLSGDADFVPAVALLRRRGKIIVGAGFSDQCASALVCECYDYVDLRDIFLRQDVAAFTIFKKVGIFERWFTDEVESAAGYNPSTSLELRAYWRFSQGDELYRIPHHKFSLEAKGSIDLSGRYQQVKEFCSKFPEQVSQITQKRCTFVVDPLIWTSVERRLQDSASSMEGCKCDLQNRSCEKEYHYNREKGEYELISSTGSEQ